MQLTVSLLHLSGGKDEQEGPAAVKRILREHRQAKGKNTTSSWNPRSSMHTYAALHVPVFECKGQRCRSVPPPRLPFWVYNIRPVVGKTGKNSENSTVRNNSKTITEEEETRWK